MRRKLIPYNPKLTALARKMRNESTKAEVILWLQLRNNQMYGYDFDRQKPIDNFILDFFCYELMLGIECDGLSHHFEEVFEKDQKKEQRLKELGVTILRFNDSQVLSDIQNVLKVIEQFILDYEKEHGQVSS
jgi:very-short-patch-repair endonuclease